MSTWSMPVQQQGQPGWKLRVLSGRALGQELQLPLNRYVLGSQAPANIVIGHPTIAPQHLTIEIFPDYIELRDCSNGRGMRVNGRLVRTARVVPGDGVEVGALKFEFSN